MESGVTSGGKKICLSDQGGKGGGGAGSLGIERDPLCLHHDRGEIKGSLLARRWNGDGGFGRRGSELRECVWRRGAKGGGGDGVGDQGGLWLFERCEVGVFCRYYTI